MILDELSCVMGFLACMVLDVIFAITNFFVERALYYRDMRKNKDDYIK